VRRAASLTAGSASSVNRSTIFEDDGDKEAFFNLLVEYRRRFPVRVLHWVITGNHYRILLRAGRPTTAHRGTRKKGGLDPPVGASRQPDR